MPVRLVIRNFPPHVDAEGASAFVAQATARGAPVRCETLYYRRGKPKTKRGVRLGSLYVEGDNDEAIAEQLARAGPPPPPPPPPSTDEAQPPPPPPKRPPVPLVVERAAFDRVFRAPTRPDRRAGTWLESPEYAAFKAYDPRQARPKTKRRKLPSTAARGPPPLPRRPVWWMRLSTVEVWSSGRGARRLCLGMQQRSVSDAVWTSYIALIV